MADQETKEFDTNVADADERVRVLILGGWSPGPLDFLRERFATACVFVEPALHMPPHGIMDIVGGSQGGRSRRVGCEALSAMLEKVERKPLLHSGLLSLLKSLPWMR